MISQCVQKEGAEAAAFLAYMRAHLGTKWVAG
jgi:hypothetical protein